MIYISTPHLGLLAATDPYYNVFSVSPQSKIGNIINRS